jgi:alkanesulfonate monooxygenase SsuD/methylene tetrahydromethanopterin reductase-like flavin-dependent oxidoreductase (luciferase family)
MSRQTRPGRVRTVDVGRTIAHLADEGGIDSLFVSDHLLQAEPGTEPTEAMLEAYTTLGHLAAITDRVRLGALVASVAMRPPALLVKTATTLDVLSNGRAWFGIGAGYLRSEAHRMGVPMRPTAERFECGWRTRCNSPGGCGRVTPLRTPDGSLRQRGELPLDPCQWRQASPARI